ncbi:Uncharacterised protein [uncultured Roseburia sp.]|uniref:DUF5721 family protein n=1 Tax=Brotonthovivens ammoniilytica TaxID=2981725 RepID=A0ABT2TLW9_9FIRM|nr:DUF5721 family protein [Brotonthovivens ammoniilytica]MCU6763209.1 DUF5721 family protein [Brotonthovivens ammoniilytica]SCJ06860.1 Uncharacterised protein [uncultured Roseburia sp.]
MTAFEISDIKHFMNQLLLTSLFDHFLFTEGTISTGVTYTIDGHINDSFYSEADLKELKLQDLDYLPFGQLRSTCFSIIKGKNTPVSFRFVLMLSPENMRHTIERSGSGFTAADVSGMFINLTYKNQKLICTTGISYKLFSTDKTLDYEWDLMVEKFFHQHQIPIEKQI